MIGIEFDTERFPISVGVPQRSWYEVRLRVDGAEVAECERMVECGMADRTPEVYYLEASFEE